MLRLWIQLIIKMFLIHFHTFSVSKISFQEDCEKMKKDNQDDGFCIIEFTERKGSQVMKDVINCSQALSLQVKQRCMRTRTLQEGHMSFCLQSVTDGHYITCCVKNYECESSWKTIRYKFPQVAENFQKDPDKYLNETIAMEKYKTCHKIEGLNANICHEDCEKMRSTKFASRCNDRGGVFKCCVRRDKANCHECRYCCTLPICSWTSNKEVIHATEDVLNKIVEEEQKEKSFFLEEKYRLGSVVNSQTAYTISSLNAMDIFYKNLDERCLKANLSRPPEEWGHYVPDEFVRALDLNDMRTSQTVEYDNNFFNFEDPEVFKAFTNSSYKKMWRKVYGFDDMEKMDYNGFSEGLECAKKCMKAEKSKFARQCAKRGGLFKCCVFSLDMEIFERTRILLEEKKLLRSGEKVTHFCDMHDKTSHCFICFASYMCSEKDSLNMLKNTYMTEEPNPVGGITIRDNADYNSRKFAYERYGSEFVRFGLRFTFCEKLDFCKILPHRYSPEDFILAKDIRSFCAIKEMDGEKLLEISKAEQIECRKRKSNVRICPEKELERLDDMRLTAINKELREYAKKLKKRKKKKSKGRKKKQKKARRKKSKH